MHRSTISHPNSPRLLSSSPNTHTSPDEEDRSSSQLQGGSNMGALVPQQAAVLLAALLAVSFFGATAWKKAEAAAPPPVVVGCVKCLDCSSNDGNAFKDLQVAIKCKSGADESYETRALGPLDDTGVFRIPLAAELLRDDGSMDRDCFAQLHSSLDTPCVGQAPPRIAPTSQLDGGDSTTYLAAATDDTVFAPVACACGKKKKKHFMFGPPPPPPRPTPTPNPPTTPTYGPPTPTPTPVPEPRPPAPEEPEPFFKKKHFMHKKKPCPPLVDDDDTTRPAVAGEQGQEKLPKKLN